MALGFASLRLSLKLEYHPDDGTQYQDHTDSPQATAVAPHFADARQVAFAVVVEPVFIVFAQGVQVKIGGLVLIRKF